MNDAPDRLHVARPGECNVQRTPAADATGRATPGATTPLRAAALRVLARNRACNNRATSSDFSVQHEASADEADVALLGALAELTGLVAQHHGFSPGDLSEAQALAARHVAEALRCFRALAVEIPEAASSGAATDDRITCRQCTNHVAGRCRVDGRGTVVDQPRRCLAFEPRPEETDRRTGRERWGWLRAVPDGERPRADCCVE